MSNIQDWKFFVFLILKICASIGRSFVWGQEINQEQLLIKSLMRNYEPSVRPVKNFTTTINIYFKMKLTQILELSEKDQTLITNIWVEQQWMDEFLTWDPDDFSGIRSLRMPSNKIWLPDTFIYNSASTQEGAHTTINGPYAMLRYDGLVKFPVPMKLKSNCEVDIAYFPFDNQICYIKFASWIHDLSAVNLSSFETNIQMRNIKSSIVTKKEEKLRIELSKFDNNIDLSGYVDNSGWILLNVKFFRREKNHTNGIYPELIYFVHIKRRYLYYIFNVIIPCAMLSMLTCMTFWLPCITGEKVSMGLTCFVAYSVFMLMVAEKVPATSETVPIISIYLTVVMSFTSVSVIMAVIVTNIHEKTKTSTSKEHRLPKLMRKIFLNKIAKVLGMQKRAKELLKYMIKLDKKERENAAATAAQNCKFNNLSSTKSRQGQPSGDNSIFQMIANDMVSKYESNVREQTYDEPVHAPRSENIYYTDYSDEENSNYMASINGCRESFLLLADKTAACNDVNSPIWVKSLDNVRNRDKSRRDLFNEMPYAAHTMNENVVDSSLPVKTKATKKHKNRYRIKKDNISLYFAYEYVLFALILDRLFFWIYTIATLFSYIITLYVLPFMVQNNKKEFLSNVP